MLSDDFVCFLICSHFLFSDLLPVLSLLAFSYAVGRCSAGKEKKAPVTLFVGRVTQYRPPSKPNQNDDMWCVQWEGGASSGLAPKRVSELRFKNKRVVT